MNESGPQNAILYPGSVRLLRWLELPDQGLEPLEFRLRLGSASAERRTEPTQIEATVERLRRDQPPK